MREPFDHHMQSNMASIERSLKEKGETLVKIDGFTCPNCKKVLRSISMLDLHRCAVPFQCPECRKSLISNQELNIHRFKVHNKELSVCQFCEKGFGSKFRKLAHEKTEHVGDTLKQKTHTCPHCMKVFETIDAFRLHLRMHSFISTQRCPECKPKQKFDSHEELSNHRSKVHGKVLYPCAFCKKGLLNIYNKKTHEKNMHGTPDAI